MNPGEIFGPYRIIEPLGQGGMGEVFVAEDTRLRRRVALKILPAPFANDPAARQRFEREAQAVAALNHPNIVTIHSVEDYAGRLFLTMELVEGKPLGELIPRGGLPLDRVLRIGIDAADAMAAAQQKGITHRDVKPANIMITPSGRAKVLDFGLAKVREAEAALAPDDVTRMSSHLTGQGKIVGTVAYMSPEQAEGKPVDPRSDIFSLGVVLHEMATGERPFKGDTTVSVISSIMKDTPAPVTDSNPNLPADLARIIRRCLAKDAERRYQTATDLRNELEDLKEDTTTGPVTVTRPTRRSGRAMLVGAMALLAVALGTAAWFVLRGRESSSQASGAKFTIDRLSRLTSTGTAFIAALSPDGRYAVHAKREEAGFGLWIRQTVTTSDVRIVAPSDMRIDGVAFAPDGNFVYYTGYSGGGGVASLYRVPALGGSPSRVLQDIDSGIAFAPDGGRFAFMRGAISRGTANLIVAGADGSNARVLAEAPLPDKFQLEAPSWSADGKTILATATSTRPGAPAIVYAIDAQSGQGRTIGEPWGYLRDVQWLPDGRSFLLTAIDLSGLASPQIWQIAYPSGERTRVTNDLNAYVGLSVAADALSLATVQTETTANIFVANGPNQEPRAVTKGPGRADGIGGLDWLPDGRIVYTSAVSALPQLWIANEDGSNIRQLTSVSTPANAPAAARDGTWIYFTGWAREGIAIFRIAPDGSGLQQLTTDGDARASIISPDGRTLYYTAMRTGFPVLMKMLADGGKPERVSDRHFRAQSISPNGTLLLGTTWSEEQRRSVPAAVSLNDGALHVLPDLALSSLFLPDGGFASVRRVQGRSEIVAQSDSGGAPRPLTPPTDANILTCAVSRDGRVAFSRGQSVSDVVLIKAASHR